MTEKEHQAQLVQVVEMLGGMVYHTYDSRRSSQGYPDLAIVTADRRLIFAELKVGKKQPTEMQWVWLRALPDHQAYLWRPDDWDDAVRIIQYGHRVSAGMPQGADGVHVRPIWVSQHEPTCIACQSFRPASP